MAVMPRRASAEATARLIRPAPMMPGLGMISILPGMGPGQAVRPPSATMSAPVTKAASGLARKATTLATSSGRP